MINNSNVVKVSVLASEKAALFFWVRASSYANFARTLGNEAAVNISA